MGVARDTVKSTHEANCDKERPTAQAHRDGGPGTSFAVATDQKFSTSSRGYRSALEAEYAREWADAGYAVVYEPTALRREGIAYQPDFYVQASDENVVYEVKGVLDPADLYKITDYARSLRRDRTFCAGAVVVDKYVVAFRERTWTYDVQADRWEDRARSRVRDSQRMIRSATLYMSTPELAREAADFLPGPTQVHGRTVWVGFSGPIREDLVREMMRQAAKACLVNPVSVVRCSVAGEGTADPEEWNKQAFWMMLGAAERPRQLTSRAQHDLDENDPLLRNTKI